MELLIDIGWIGNGARHFHSERLAITLTQTRKPRAQSRNRNSKFGGRFFLLSQEEAAAKLGVPIATLRTWLSRLRQRYREALRMEVASTVSDPADVDQELHYLHQILTT